MASPSQRRTPAITPSASARSTSSGPTMVARDRDQGRHPLGQRTIEEQHRRHVIPHDGDGRRRGVPGRRPGRSSVGPCSAHQASRRRYASSSPSTPSSRRTSSRMVQRLADHRARRDAEMVHHGLAVEAGADRRQLLGVAQLVDADLEVVHPTRQRGRLFRVASRAIAPGQHVELGQQITGVADVPTNRRVAPTHLVGVEPQVQEHQLRPRGDVRSRVAQCFHPLPGHPCADHVVMVERRALAGLIAAGAGLADVVEQRRQSGDAVVELGRVLGRTDVVDHRDRVAQHVLVPVDRIVLEPQPRAAPAGTDRPARSRPGTTDPEPGGRPRSANRTHRASARPTRI